MKKKLTKEEKKEARQQKKNTRKMVFSKMSQSRSQKIKQERKKNIKEKSKKPRSYRARRWGAVLFWVLFGFMFMVVLTSLLSSPSSADHPPKTIVQKQNPATQSGAVEFAKRFAAAYFTWGWTDQAMNQRKERLAPYLADGLDEQAGLDVSDIRAGAQFEDATVERVKDLGDNKAYITLKVNYKLTPKPEENPSTTINEPNNQNQKAQKRPAKENDTKNKKGKPNKKASSSKKKSKTTETAYQGNKTLQNIVIPVANQVTSGNVQTPGTKASQQTKKKSSHYFVVPVAYNGTFGVYELPKITYIVEKTTVKSSDPENLGLDGLEDSRIEDSIRNFLPIFFKSYAQDSKDQLMYVLEDKDHLNGLHQRVDFVDVQDQGIYQGKANNQYIVFCQTTFKDPASGALFKTDYRLVVGTRSQQYVVLSINEK